MALTKAVAVGATAAIAVPFLMRDLTGQLGDIVQTSTMHVTLSGHHLYWNWPIFCVITLAAFFLLKAAES